MAEPARLTKAHCNKCLHETTHFILYQEVQDESDIDEDHKCITFRAESKYEMLKCRGCDQITFRSTYRGDDDPGGSCTYYPPAISRPRPSWFDADFWYSHGDLSSLLEEVYSALHLDSCRLAMMGLRTVIDMVLLDTVGDTGTFRDKLDGLVSKGFVSSRNREFLAAALDLGNAAAHRGHLPSATEVGQVMDIVENLLQSVYVFESVAESLRKTTPPRAPRPNGATTEEKKPPVRY